MERRQIPESVSEALAKLRSRIPQANQRPDLKDFGVESRVQLVLDVSNPKVKKVLRPRAQRSQTKKEAFIPIEDPRFPEPPALKKDAKGDWVIDYEA